MHHLDIEGLSVLPYGLRECDYNKYHFESMLVIKTQAIELALPKCVQWCLNHFKQMYALVIHIMGIKLYNLKTWHQFKQHTFVEFEIPLVRFYLWKVVPF